MRYEDEADLFWQLHVGFCKQMQHGAPEFGPIVDIPYNLKEFADAGIEPIKYQKPKLAENSREGQ